MNDPLKRLEALATSARREAAPRVRVSDRVLAAVAEREAEDRFSLAWVTAASALGAALASGVMLSWCLSWEDPVVSMLANLSWGLL